MQNVLLYLSLIMLGLSTNACVKPEAMPTSTIQEVNIEPVYVEPVYEPQPLPQATTGTIATHQLKTVQGPMLSITERSNGFLFPQFEHKIVLIQIFGKECEYCFEEMPFIQQMYNRYQGNLEVIALQAQKKMSPSKAQNIIQNFQINYPIIDRDEAEGLLRFVNKTYGWSGVLPYFLLVKDGVTEYSFSGKVNQQEFEEAIQSLL